MLTEALVDLVISTACCVFYICFLSDPLINQGQHENDHEEGIIEVFLGQLRQRVGANRRIPVRMLYFVERTIPNFNEIEFQSHFRLNRESFNWLINALGRRLESPVGRHVIDPHKQLLAVLWLLATPDSYR